MAGFYPHAGMTLDIGQSCYRFAPHPLFPEDRDQVWVCEGGEAFIYQLQHLSSGDLFALKVFKPSYRSEHVARSVAAIAPCAHLPGLQLAARRVCLTQHTAADLITDYPQLEYAVLMPWISGPTWAGVIANRTAGGPYTHESARGLALATAQALWELEAHHLAHTDLAGGNVICLPNRGVALLDMENLYLSGTTRPKQHSMGSPGYQHRRLDLAGYWRPDGDRFSGAILLAEILTWWNPDLRSLVPDGAQSIFRPDELQETDVPQWVTMRDALWEICPPALQLFDAAWASSDLSECPELGNWAICLLQAASQ